MVVNQCQELTKRLTAAAYAIHSNNNNSHINESKLNNLFIIGCESFFFALALTSQILTWKKGKKATKKKIRTDLINKKVFFCFPVIYTMFGIDLDLYFR